jgi:hypothetical protein
VENTVDLSDEDLAKLDKRQFANACQAALEAFRTMYGLIDNGADADDLVEDEDLWPLTQLREALGKK